MNIAALPPDFYQALAEHSIDLITVMRIDGHVVYESPSVTRILGYSREELIGTNALGRLHPLDLPHVVGLIAKGKIHPEKHYTIRVRSKHKDGSWRWLEVTAQFLSAQSGLPMHILVQARDVTVEKEAQDKLKESEERFRLLFDISQEGFAIHDDGVVVYANKTMADMYHMTVDELIGQNGLERITLDSKKAVLDTWAKHESKPLELVGVRKDGSMFRMITYGKPVMYQGKPMRMFSARDVTAERQMTDALKISEEKFRSLAESAPNFVMMVDTSGMVQYINRTNPGVKKEDIVGKHLYYFAGPAHRDRVKEAFGRVISQGTIENIESEAPRHDGSIAWYQTSMSPIRKGEHIEGAVVISSDITKARKVQEQLSILSEAVSQSPVAIVITDKDAKITYVNPAFTKLTGYSTEEMLGENPRKVKSGKTPISVYRTLWNTILAGKVWEGDILNRKKDGSEYWEHMIVSPVKDQNQIITHFIALKEDSTKARQDEAALKAQKEILERTNELMVGRELRMKELKERITELERKLAVK